MNETMLIIGKYGSTSYIGMIRKKMAANRKGIGLTTLKHACNSTTNTRTKYLSVVMHKTLCSVWLTFSGGRTRRSKIARLFLRILHHHHHHIIIILIRCNSQTTQAAELTQTCTQIAPPILQTSPIKEGTQHGTTRVSKDSDGFLQHSP